MAEIVEMVFSLEGIKRLLDRFGEKEVALSFAGERLVKIFGVNLIETFIGKKRIRFVFSKNENWNKMMDFLKKVGVKFVAR